MGDDVSTGQNRSQPGVTPNPRGEARRRSILATAVELFGARGFNSVSLADIAREVGITQAGILHYYPTKAALLLAVLQQREEENLASRLRREQAGEPPLEAYVGMLSENDRHPELVQLFVMLSAESTATDHPGHAWFTARNQRTLTGLLANVQHTFDERKLPEGVTPEVLARWIAALSLGLGGQWVNDPCAFDRAGLVGLFLDLLTPYLRDDASGAR